MSVIRRNLKQIAVGGVGVMCGVMRHASLRKPVRESFISFRPEISAKPAILAKPASTEAGMVTSEFAIVLPIFLFFGFVLASAIVSGWQVMHVSTEAKEIAREFSIDGQTTLAARAKSTGADVDVSVEGDIVSVTVHRAGGGVYDWLGIEFVGTHEMVVEPGVRRG